ncbi:GntR family transcriptional regulator [Jeotgalibaca porci]|uniref:GntR family transcriptional regulator n=2 Tax=Jeotgalibaca porci TaxID=1868793 RepID=UPI0035A0DD00
MDFKEISPKRKMLENILHMINTTTNVDEPLPSERKLCEDFGVSRTTVRAAIQELIARNELISKPGRGTFINTSILKVNLEALDSTTEKIRGAGKVVRSKILKSNVIEANKDLALTFSVSLGDKLFELKRIRFMDDEPFSLDTTYLNVNKFPGIEAIDFTDDSLFRVLKDVYRVNLNHGEETFEISYANYEESLHLRIEEGKPVIVLEGQVFDKEDKLVEISKQIIRADKIKYHYSVINE